MSRVIVIGSGPAGLFSAITAGRAGHRVMLLEKNQEIAIKLRMSGSGQCNFTHSGGIMEFSSHYGERSKAAERILKRFDNVKLMDFFTENGVNCYIREDGKVFPASMKSRDVVNLLVKTAGESETDILLNQAVKSIAAEDGKILLKTADKRFVCDKVIMATGGMTYPKTGSDGTGIGMAKSLGHSVEELKVGLSPVYVKNFELAEMAGISFENAGMVYEREGKAAVRKRGSLLITHRGFSGPLILDNSRFFKAGEIIKLNFTVFKDSEEFEKEMVKSAALSGTVTLKRFLNEIGIPARFADRILDMVQVKSDLRISQLGKADRKKIVRCLTGYGAEIRRLGSVSESMVTVGGISLDDINTSTMESKIIKGLYFCGEMLDIDGDTGGYNIQMAFSTGYIAGSSID